MRPKIILYLRAREGVSAPALISALHDEAERLDRLSLHHLHHTRGEAVFDDSLLKAAAGEYTWESPFDAVMMVARQDAGALAAVLPHLEGFAARLRSHIDPGQSAAIAGMEHAILPGGGDLLVTTALRRLSHLTQEAFLDYWLNKHAKFALRPEIAAILRYRQVHGDLDLTKRLAQATGLSIEDYHAEGELYFATTEEIAKLLGRPSGREGSTADEKTFQDHARCKTNIFRIRTLNP